MPTTEFEKELDTIMEDLIVGHNFEYARKAILELFNRLMLRERREELSYVDPWVAWVKHGIMDGLPSVTSMSVRDRIASIDKQLKEVE